MSIEDLSVFSVYLTTAVWVGLYLWSRHVCAQERRADKRELTRVRMRNLILLIPLAEDRLKRANYFYKMAHARLFIGALAIYLLYLIPPVPDASLFQTLLRVVFILDAWWFLQAKRTDRASRARSKKVTVEDDARSAS